MIAKSTQLPVSMDNVVRELVAAGKTWKAYAESLPSVGYLGGDTTSGGGQYYVVTSPLLTSPMCRAVPPTAKPCPLYAIGPGSLERKPSRLLFHHTQRLR